MIIRAYLNFVKWFMMALVVTIAGLGATLRELDVDYILIIIAILISSPLILLSRLSKYDLCWLVALVQGSMFLAFYLLKVDTEVNPIIQSLMFFIPIAGLLSRHGKINEQLVINWLFILTIICIIGMIPYSEKIFFAITSSYERARFHTYFSIAICFPLMALLVTGLVRSYIKLVILVFGIKRSSNETNDIEKD